VRRGREAKELEAPKRTISPAAIAEALGLRAKKPERVPDTPAAARLRAAIMEEAADEFKTFTTSEEERQHMFGVTPPLAEGEFRKIEPRRPPPSRDEDEAAAPERPFTRTSRDAPTGEAAELAAQYHAHAAKIQKMAEEARGDAAKEARVAAEVRASAEVGERLKARGIL
jgi:hypothetical protein